jgi:hypothetical protein
MDASRDPRVEPRPGDQVCVGKETREVAALYNGRVQYSWPNKIAIRSQTQREWQRWAGSGQIVKVAS